MRGECQGKSAVCTVCLTGSRLRLNSWVLGGSAYVECQCGSDQDCGGFVLY